MYIAYASTTAVATTLQAKLLESLVIMIIGMGAVFLMLTIAMLGMILIGKVSAPSTENIKQVVKDVKAESVSQGKKIDTNDLNDTDGDIAAIVAVIHHLRNAKSLEIPIIKRRDI